MTSPISSSVSVPKPRLSFADPAKLKQLQKHLEACVESAPDKPMTINDNSNNPVKLPPHVATAVFAAEEFFERAKMINPPVLEPIYGIQAMERVMEKGMCKTSPQNTYNMLIQAAATGSDQLFTLPLEHGLKPPDKSITRQIFDNARDFVHGAIENASKARQQQAPDLSNQKDWEKWMTVLRLRHHNSSERMKGILHRYDMVHQFLDALKNRASETRQKDLVNGLAAEKEKKLAPSKSAKRKARQKAARAERNLAEQQNILPTKGLPSPVSTASPDSLLTQPEPPGGLNPNTFAEAGPSASQAPERTGTGKGKTRRTADRKRDQRNIIKTTNRQQVLQSASLPAASGSSSVVTRSVPEPVNAFAALRTVPEDRVEMLTPTSLAGNPESSAIIERLQSASRDADPPLPKFNVAEADAFLKARWDAAMKAVEDPNSNVYIYRGGSSRTP